MDQDNNLHEAFDDEDDASKSADHAICSFFYSVTKIFTNVLTVSGRNTSIPNHQRFAMSYERGGGEFEDDYSDDEETIN